MMRPDYSDLHRDCSRKVLLSPIMSPLRSARSKSISVAFADCVATSGPVALCLDVALRSWWKLDVCWFRMVKLTWDILKPLAERDYTNEALFWMVHTVVWSSAIQSIHWPSEPETKTAKSVWQSKIWCYISCIRSRFRYFRCSWHVLVHRRYVEIYQCIKWCYCFWINQFNSRMTGVSGMFWMN